MLKSLELLDILDKIEGTGDYNGAISFTLGFLGQDVDNLTDEEFSKLRAGLEVYAKKVAIDGNKPTGSE